LRARSRFSKLEEALGNSVVVAIASPAHAAVDEVIAQLRPPIAASELATLV